MTTTLDGQLYSISLANTLNSTSDLQGTPAAAMAIAKSFGWSSGNGSGQADAVWADTRTIAASSSEALDLAGVLTDVFGNLLTFARIKLMYFAASGNNANNVLIGGAAANAFVNWVADATDVVTLRPGGAFFLAAPGATGYAVTAGTGDQLKVANSGAGTGVTYDVVLIGSTL